MPSGPIPEPSPPKHGTFYGNASPLPWPPRSTLRMHTAPGGPHPGGTLNSALVPSGFLLLTITLEQLLLFWPSGNNPDKRCAGLASRSVSK
ncbi:MAG: hypothetical protein FJ333_11145 [Sphingomonadales bacterium]|nr:hypothetical protein [Sphingomonadales bacterium]